jgi:oligoendopeptidase F
MSATTRPITPEDLRDAGWDQILPFYEHLAERPLDDPNAWLAEWSAFEEVLGEARAMAYTAYTGDTADPAKEEAHLRFASQIAPRAQEQEVRLGRRLFDSGYTRPDLEPMLARQRNQDELFRAESVPLVAELQRLASSWQKLVGGLSADWDGRRLPLPALRGFEASPDRSIRESAYRKHFAPYVASRDEIATIFDRMLELRQQVAHNAGFASYRDYAHLARNRFSYSVKDCLPRPESSSGAGNRWVSTPCGPGMRWTVNAAWPMPMAGRRSSRTGTATSWQSGRCPSLAGWIPSSAATSQRCARSGFST